MIMMNLDELIARAIPILPHDCRLKKAQKQYERDKMKTQAMAQMSGKSDVYVRIGKYELRIKREVVNDLIKNV